MANAACARRQQQATRKGDTKRRHHPPSRHMGDSEGIHGGLTKMSNDSQFYESRALQIHTEGQYLVSITSQAFLIKGQRVKSPAH